MQAADTSDNFQKAVLERLDNLKVELDSLKVDVDRLRQELGQTNLRLAVYQKASNCSTYI
ncbi:MAG: hypothetical protein SNJ57_20400 [Cyanobacteriota bacterium]